MPLVPQDSRNGTTRSPGGFEFGLQGWSWSEPRPSSITFFLDGSAMVSDQYGRAIKGAVIEGKEVFFAVNPPKDDKMMTGEQVTRVSLRADAKLATHAQVIAALVSERVEWSKLTVAGWPQLPYEELKKLSFLPSTPVEELKKIPDVKLRKDALRARKEASEAMAREVAAAEAEE